MSRSRLKLDAKLSNMPGQCCGPVWASSIWSSSAKLCRRMRSVRDGPSTTGHDSVRSWLVHQTNARKMVMPNNDWIVLNHLDRMTDSTGLIQHAIYSVPRRDSGYTTDDNARALRLCARLWRQEPDDRMLNRITTYLSFLEHAQCPVRGFHNFLSYQRDWLDAGGTGDCQGQAIRALAEVLGSNLPDGFRDLASELIQGVLPALAELRSLRAQAYLIFANGHLWTAGIKNM